MVDVVTFERKSGEAWKPWLAMVQLKNGNLWGLTFSG